MQNFKKFRGVRENFELIFEKYRGKLKKKKKKIKVEFKTIFDDNSES